jgi:hypothetical protein
MLALNNCPRQLIRHGSPLSGTGFQSQEAQHMYIPLLLRRVSLFIAACAIAASAITAMADSSEAAFAADNNAAMSRMMAGMDVKPSGDIDRDFAALMIPHHQGAIDMALAELRYGNNEQLRRIAQEIIVDQQQEIAAMRLALGQPPPASAPAPTQVTAAAAPNCYRTQCTQTTHDEILNETRTLASRHALHRAVCLRPLCSRRPGAWCLSGRRHTGYPSRSRLRCRAVLEHRLSRRPG